MAKYEKSEVQFEHPAKGPHHCSECVHFLGASKCRIVQGVVKPEDWCKEFERRSTVHSVGV